MPKQAAYKSKKNKKTNTKDKKNNEIKNSFTFCHYVLHLLHNWNQKTNQQYR